MANSPIFKIYINKAYIGAVKDPLDAYIILQFHQQGEIRYGHKRVLFTFATDIEDYDQFYRDIDRAVNSIWTQ